MQHDQQQQQPRRGFMRSLSSLMRLHWANRAAKHEEIMSTESTPHLVEDVRAVKEQNMESNAPMSPASFQLLSEINGKLKELDVTIHEVNHCQTTADPSASLVAAKSEEDIQILKRHLRTLMNDLHFAHARGQNKPHLRHHAAMTKLSQTLDLKYALLMHDYKTQGRVTLENAVKRVPKRISARPPPIRIPMVKVHDARIQEIELLRDAPRLQHADRRQRRPVM